MQIHKSKHIQFHINKPVKLHTIVESILRMYDCLRLPKQTQFWKWKQLGQSSKETMGNQSCQNLAIIGYRTYR